MTDVFKEIEDKLRKVLSEKLTRSKKQWAVFYEGKPIKVNRTGVKTFISYKVAKLNIYNSLKYSLPWNYREDLADDILNKVIDSLIERKIIEIKQVV